MIIARVCGNIYSTINHKFYDNKRLLIVEPLTVQGKSSGKYLIAVDSVDAGVSGTVRSGQLPGLGARHPDRSG